MNNTTFKSEVLNFGTNHAPINDSLRAAFVDKHYETLVECASEISHLVDELKELLAKGVDSDTMLHELHFFIAQGWTRANDILSKHFGENLTERERLVLWWYIVREEVSYSDYCDLMNAKELWDLLHALSGKYYISKTERYAELNDDFDYAASLNTAMGQASFRYLQEQGVLR